MTLTADNIFDVAAGFVEDDGNQGNGLLEPLTNHLTPPRNLKNACKKVNNSDLLTDQEKQTLIGLIEIFFDETCP